MNLNRESLQNKKNMLDQSKKAGAVAEATFLKQYQLHQSMPHGGKSDPKILGATSSLPIKKNDSSK